jgi:hypothetical protein
VIFTSTSRPTSKPSARRTATLRGRRKPPLSLLGKSDVCQCVSPILAETRIDPKCPDRPRAASRITDDVLTSIFKKYQDAALGWAGNHCQTGPAAETVKGEGASSPKKSDGRTVLSEERLAFKPTPPPSCVPSPSQHARRAQILRAHLSDNDPYSCAYLRRRLRGCPLRLSAHP